MSNWQPYPSDLVHGHTVHGNLLQWPNFHSPQLDNQRDLLVLLPSAYETRDQRFPVLYMHDGQNLFDAATSFAGQEWQVDETMQLLSTEGIDAIVVGIPHMHDQRLAEYNPFAHRNHGKGEHYLRFLLDTIKPTIDRDFRTLATPDNTALLGSSMGGLISLYGFFRYPELFGRAAVMSPALWYGGFAIFDFVRHAPLNPGKLYLDNGSRESSARPMYQLLKEKGYQSGKNLKYVAEQGGKHTESAWARRFPHAVRFLME